MTIHPQGFTCDCGNPVNVTRRVGGAVLIWHYSRTCGSVGVNARNEAEALAFWTAERQRRASA